MEYLTQKEFKEMTLLSCQKIEEKKEEINKINVFPVPDQDTGTNLAKTLSGIKKAIKGREFKNLSEISQTLLEGALAAAQGNAGVIYTGFLAGFLPQFNKNPVNAKKLALAFEKGAQKARLSIQNPKEGTILDVIDAASQSLKTGVEKESDIIILFKMAVEKAKEALLATREKMEIFRKANVVDAGGLGFLIILESYLEALEPSFAKAKEGEEKPSEKIKRFVQVLSHRYEVVSLLENSSLAEEKIKERLKRLGNSIDVVQIGKKIKLHIHTDYPEEVRDVIRQFGRISEIRVEDMAKEVVGEESVRKVSIGMVTDNVATLLPKILERYQIEMVEAKYEWPEEKDLPGENLYQKIREAKKRGLKVTIKTTQANPKSYSDVFEKQLQKFDKVLCLTITSKLSGCYNSAIQARETLKTPERVFVFDSFTGAAGEALLVLKSIELIQEQREIEEIIQELKNLIPKIHVYVIFEDPKWIESIGRITKSQANWVRRINKIGLYPLMELKEGKVEKGGIVFAKSPAEALLKKVLRESKKNVRAGKKIRAIINHADNLQEATKLKKMLKEKINVEIPYINLAPPLIGAATGPGTLIVGWTPLE